MTRHAAAVLAAVFIFPLIGLATAAEGSRYHWASPGVHFGAPVAISDRDESPRSDSTIRLTFPRAALPDGRSETILNMDFMVSENAALGYSYGGFAIPFPSPVGTVADGQVSFLVQSRSRVSSFQVVLRDEQLRRSTHKIELEAGEEWTAVRLPLGEFDPPVESALESIAFVVLGAEAGSLRLADLKLPVQTETMALTTVSRIQLRPKWYTHARMAELVAGHLDSPLLVFTTPDQQAGMLAARALEADESWAPILSRTTNLLLADPQSPAPSLRLFIPDSPGRLEALDPDDPATPHAIAAALAEWETD